ncbi:MAG: SPOR domain-containing protein [Bacteroidota bacterium]
MKNISLLFTILLTIIISSCGGKEETTEENIQDTEIIDETADTSAYLDDIEFVSDESDAEINPVDSTLQEDLDYPENTTEVQVDPPVEEETVVEEVKETPVVVKEEKVHQKRFYVVVGSFKKFSNAQNLNKYFEQKGYHPMILPVVNGYNRVAISSYIEKANAKKAVTKLRNEYNDLTFWIYQW